MSNILNAILSTLFVTTNDWGLAILTLTVIVKLLILPLSIKQKLSMTKQQELSQKVSLIKEKYKTNTIKMNKELDKHYRENRPNLLGFAPLLIQLPIILSLYRVIRTINVDVGSILIPWVSSIQSPDSTYILPVIYALISISPSLLKYISFLKKHDENKSILQNAMGIVMISVFVISRSPVALGIYFVTSSLVSLLEEVIYRLILRRQKLRTLHVNK